MLADAMAKAKRESRDIPTETESIFYSNAAKKMCGGDDFDRDCSFMERRRIRSFARDNLGEGG